MCGFYLLIMVKIYYEIFVLSQSGYMVIIPDYFDGGMIDPTSAPKEELIDFVEKQFQWDGKLKEDWEEKIRPYALKHGAKTFGAIGIFKMWNWFVCDKHCNMFNWHGLTLNLERKQLKELGSIFLC